MKRFSLKAAFCGLLSALALIAFTLENLFPPLFIPGARMGLSNVFILLAAVLLGPWYAFAALAIKTLLGSLIGGNFSAVMYSLPAGAVALTAEILLLNFAKKTSLVAASVFGAAINIILQNTAFCLIAGAKEYFVYLPYLSLIGAGAGLIVGLAVHITVKRLPEKFFGGDSPTKEEKIKEQ